MPAGRPSLYEPEFAAQARKLAELGATDLEVADFFEVDVATVHRWKLKHDEFRDALKIGKEVADTRVEDSLYRRATGYTHRAVKIMQHEGVPVVEEYDAHVPPDVTACIFWLKNRRKADWRDRHEHTADEGLSALLREALAPRLGGTQN